MTKHEKPAISSPEAEAAFAMAVKFGANRGDLHTVSDALRKIASAPTWHGVRDALDVYRAALRQQIQANMLLGSGQSTFCGSFDGCGDSGNYYVSTGDEDVDEFLTGMLEKHVTFDWYNNDGGGGDITWDVVTNKVIINGYTNVVETISQMHEEEF